MLPTLIKRMLTEVNPRLLANFVVQFGLRNLLAIERFKRRSKRGEQWPPFLFLSVTNRCNLRCAGCWVSVDAPPAELDLETIDRVIRAGRKRGTHFYGILGGEPLLHAGLTDIFARHRDCYFQLFTNGTLMTDELARDLARCGNVTPLVSVEGTATVSDERRGGQNVLNRTLGGIEACRRAGLLTGVATSVCKTNFEDLANEEFLRKLIDLQVQYAWYYAYRPSGADPSPELALDADELVRLREFVVNIRAKLPLIIVDTYYDAEGKGLCPAAAGISYHISPWGDVEPCPPIQFAVENLADKADPIELIEGSTFLRDFREMAAGATRGCVLLERPELLKRFVEEHGARDSSGRATAMAELEAMTARPSQHQPGREIPEKHWMYRFAKKHWFFGFGAYA
jgi:MoaA/NifB/PqqE/SkfB family radical SAM enzyme